MEKNILLCNLYDHYGMLLTDKQRKYFQDYYFENFTLSEMSENYQVSRNAIHNLLKDTEEKLLNYEEKLNLYKRSQEIRKTIAHLDDKIKMQIEKLL